MRYTAYGLNHKRGIYLNSDEELIKRLLKLEQSVAHLKIKIDALETRVYGEGGF